MSGAVVVRGPATQEAWGLVRSMLDDMADMVLRAIFGGFMTGCTDLAIKAYFQEG